MDWQAEWNSELDAARAARAGGNEGRARVCARRAAGIVIREWLRRQGRPAAGASAYELLRDLSEREDLSAQARAAAVALTERVDETFHLPRDADLIEMADQLCRELLTE